MTPAEGSTIIGRSMKIHGEFSGTEDLFIDGEIDGTVRLAAARLTVRAEGRVVATVFAQDVIVFGRIEGEIRVTGRLELRAGAEVIGNVFAARLSIEEGAVLRGAVDPTRTADAAAGSEHEAVLA